MTLADRALKRISKLAPDQVPRYAEALRDSIVWDRDEDLNPPSPENLSAWHSLPLRALLAQLVVLSKNDVSDLLKEIGQPMGLPTIRRTLNAKAYRERFDREVARVGNQLVFTYAEAVELCDFTGDIDPPESLANLLPGG